MRALWSTPLPGVLLTLALYLAARWLQRRSGNHVFVNPTALTIAGLVVVLVAAGIPYPTYFESARILHLLLGPATVALAVPLARSLPMVGRLALPVTAGLVAGNLAALGSAVLLGRILGADREVVLSLAPKSVTTPIAMGIAAELGGLPSLTAVLVILTGILGAVLGPWTLDRLGIRDPATRGTAMGVAAHGLGTAAIYAESPQAGAFGGLAMGLSGLLTAATAPVLVRWLGVS
jgi:predicted murein hydrolase (TIGR00659 family)